ncbi:MAG: M48 family metalloprotease [Acidobacteria bacterium]|nr:M48 family metalloprotease [Acidobacteriota bacterium]MBU4253884.1 M48 family metalloprotease [Acidobacteriota bacterium]
MLRLKIFVLTLILALSLACAINPVTGQKELMLISEAQEIQMGKETHQSISQQFGIYEDPALSRYISELGQAMGPLTHRPHLEYHFYILDTPVVNAFAAPGGFIYVTRGALSLMKSEAELASIIGHELGHVNARHSARKLSQILLVQVGLAVGSAISETFRDISGLASVGVQLLFLKFSRDDERQADDLGIQYSRSGGWHPGKMVDFFTALQKMGDLSGGHSLPGFLSTHPLTSERIQYTKAMVEENDRYLLVKKDQYFNRLNNMVYGEDPRQGFIENNTFYHPGMRFSFAIPQDWKYQNQRNQVVMVSPDEKAGVVLQVEENTADLQSYAQARSQKYQGATFISDQSLNINGLSSYQQLYSLTQQEQTLKMRTSYIRKGSYIYTFSALSDESSYSSYDFQFGTVIGSFRELTDRRYLNRQPFRIKVIKADGRQTLESYFQKAGINKDVWPRFAIMNGMELTDVPAKNELIKVI